MAEKDSDEPKKSINEGNWPSLLAIILANLGAFAVVVRLNIDFSDALKRLDLLLPASVGLVIVSVVNGLVPAMYKNRLTFLRWNHPLPGCQARKVAIQDDRIDDKALQKHKPIPTDPKEQNAYWYALYSKISDLPSVIQANRNFLLTRDYAAISFMMIFVLGLAAAWMIPDKPGIVTQYVSGLVIQCALVRWAARNYGIEVVSNVLARTAAGLSEPHKAHGS